MQDYQYITNTQQLQRVCDSLQSSPVLALDTEFMREKTYFARLCLIQIAAEQQIIIIDPLAIDELGPFLELLYNPDILKILHAGRQDLELFYDLQGSVPEPVFDTQIAATVLGFADQIGYANLVEKILGVQLDKSHARTDWSMRPLSNQQLDYAADDVRYLVQLYPEILRRLKSLGREQWLQEDFVALTDSAQYQYAPGEIWKRVGGHGRLKSQQLVVLQQLAAWREQCARQLDKPRKWILSDDVLLNLAQRMPDKPDKLAGIRGMPETIIRDFGSELIDRIQQARALPKSEWPTPRAHFAPTRDQELLIDSLMLLVKYLAFNNQITPATLAARKEVERLVRGERELNLLKGWRRYIIGEALLDMLEGKVSIRAVDGKLEVSRNN